MEIRKIMKKISFICVFLGFIFNSSALFSSSLKTENKNLHYVFAELEGVLPCKDCKGIKTKLTLYSEGKYVGTGNFVLEEIFLGKNEKPKIVNGSWTTERGNAIDEDAVVYYLSEESLNDNSRIIRYQKINNRKVRLLDQNAFPIKSKLNYTLRSKSKIE